MESAVRKMQKRNDYNRHKLFRKIKRRRKAEAEQQSHAAEKELRKKFKMPKFDDGKSSFLRYELNNPNQARLNGETGDWLVLDESGKPIVNNGGYMLPDLVVRGLNIKKANDEAALQRAFQLSEIWNGVRYPGHGALETVSPELDALTLGSLAKPLIKLAAKSTYNLTKQGWNWANRNYALPYNLYREINNTSPLLEIQPKTIDLGRGVDESYMKAVQKGDTETALALRDLHFVNNASNSAFKDDNGNPITIFRGISEYDSDTMIIPELAENTTLGSESLSEIGLSGLRVPFFTTSREGASGYSNHVRPFYAYVENPKYINFKGKGWGTSPEKPSTIFTKKYLAENLLPENMITVTTPRGHSYLTFPVKPTEYLTPKLFVLEITPELKNKPFGPYVLRWISNSIPYELKEVLPHPNTSGLAASYKYKYDTNLSNFDSLIMQNVIDAGPRHTAYEHVPIDDVVVFNPNRIKSADPVTYFKADDPEVLSGLFKAGDVIPLSMRDNFKRNDIRFGWIPWISTIGTGVGLSAASNRRSVGGNINK